MLQDKSEDFTETSKFIKISELWSPRCHFLKILLQVCQLFINT